MEKRTQALARANTTIVSSLETTTAPRDYLQIRVRIGVSTRHGQVLFILLFVGKFLWPHGHHVFGKVRQSWQIVGILHLSHPAGQWGCRFVRTWIGNNQTAQTILLQAKMMIPSSVRDGKLNHRRRRRCCCCRHHKTCLSDLWQIEIGMRIVELLRLCCSASLSVVRTSCSKTGRPFFMSIRCQTV